jgi:DNA-directed RNA polymerase specialized sigma subunit
MNKKERKVLYALCNGDISFSEAAELLGISEEKVEKMLENYTWTPSSKKMSEFHEIEMETLSYIEEITQAKSEVSHTQIEKLGQIQSSKDISANITIFDSMMKLVSHMTKKSTIKYRGELDLCP